MIVPQNTKAISLLKPDTFGFTLRIHTRIIFVNPTFTTFTIYVFTQKGLHMFGGEF